MSSGFLHVTNGDSARFGIEGTGIPGACSIWADPLHDGPVPPGDDEIVLEARARFLSDGTDESYRETLAGLRGWRERMIGQPAGTEIVLWFEHDLFDQLNLIQLLTWIRHHLPADRPVSLICIGSYPGRPQFHGLGELFPAELAPLFDTRVPVDAAQYALAERAWTALREPHPRALDDLRRGDTSALPFLAAAVTRLLEEYPAVGDGLSKTERRLLELAEAKPARWATDYPRMHDGETAYYVSDSSLADLVETLSSTTPPLVAVAGATAPDHGGLGGTVTITDAGRDVLHGRRDRVSCGLDRWLGGVHLQSDADVWRWDERRQQIVRS